MSIDSDLSQVEKNLAQLMQDEKLKQLQVKVVQVAAEAMEAEGAIAAEHTAACSLLARVIEIVRPAIHAVGNRVQIAFHSRDSKKDSYWARNHIDLRGCGFRPGQREVGVGHYVYEGHDIALSPDGFIWRLTYSGEMSQWDKQPSSWKAEIEPVELSTTPTKDILNWIKNIGAAVILAGSRDHATNATLKRAAKLRALRDLL